MRQAGWIVAAFLVVAGLRIGAPSDMHEGDQSKQADYVLDIVCNNNWLVQHHADGSVMSKPPLYNWLAAPLVLLFGPEEIFLKMPSLLAGLAVVLMAWDMARRRMSECAATWGAVFLILTPMFAKQIYYARTDMLLTCFIVMQFWAILRWEDARNPSPVTPLPQGAKGTLWLCVFWGAAALGCLTKGPVALIPHLTLAAWWVSEKRFTENYKSIGLWWGFPLALLPLLIWFVIARRVDGAGLFERMVNAELAGRFITSAERRPFYYYIPHVFARTLPWSMFGLIGLWGALCARRNEALADRERGMLRFLATWFFAALIFFSAIPSKRADRIFPAVPALCLLGGWAFDRYITAARGRRVVDICIAAIAVAFVLIGAALTAVAFGANVAEIKMLRGAVSTATPENIVSHRTFVVFGGTIMVCDAILSMIVLSRKRAAIAVGALVASNFGFIAMYQLVLGNWIQTDYCQGALPVCREVRKRARDENAQIMLLAGSGPAARFYLLQPGLELAPEVVVKRLAAAHPAAYVVGTLPYVESDPRRAVDVRKPGALQEAGVSQSDVSQAIGKMPLSSVKWLAAVRVPKRE